VKARAPSPIAVAAARHVLAEAAVEDPSDIQVEALALRHGALVIHGRLTTAQASIVRTRTRAVICVNERWRGTPRGRHTTAHELGHHLLHKLIDHFRQCVAANEPRDRWAWRIERDADEFAAELLMPFVLARRLCTSAHPTLEDIERIARTFRTSFESSGIRLVELTKTPCAFVLTKGGQVKWATESTTFPGRIVRGRDVNVESAAARAKGRVSVVTREVAGKVWGAPGGSLLEDAIPVGRDGGVLSWIVAPG
jgi:Zn-dependent peptidase ImmA (M78 family)